MLLATYHIAIGFLNILHKISTTKLLHSFADGDLEDLTNRVAQVIQR